ncbi:MAG TPA: hypothetical protein VGW40_04595 [Allosphingosinicella sp.]|nr:hypothetical protein [Allosphingosinicella sp.]
MSAEPTPARAGKGPHWIIWVFAIVGLLGVAAFIYIAATIMRFESGRPPPAEVVGEGPELSFIVSGVRLLESSNLLQINIAAAPAGRRSALGSYSGGGGEDLRNIILLDRTTGATRRILPDNGRRIAESWFLPAQADILVPRAGDRMVAGEQTPPPPPAYFALLVAQPGQNDLFDLLVGTLAGGGQTYVMQGLEGVDSVWMQSPTRIGFIVRERFNLHYRIVDIPTLRVVQSRRIAI